MPDIISIGFSQGILNNLTGFCYGPLSVPKNRSSLHDGFCRAGGDTSAAIHALFVNYTLVILFNDGANRTFAVARAAVNTVFGNNFIHDIPLLKLNYLNFII